VSDPEVIVLVDNQAQDNSLQTEHGLSMLVTYRERKLLLDTGASPKVLRHNAKQLGVDLKDVDTVVISHGHYDHTGGLGAMFTDRRQRDLYAHPQVFAKRWREAPGEPLKDVSCTHRPEVLRAAGAKIHSVDSPTELEDGLIISGPIGGPQPEGESFVIRRGGDLVPDTFEDETALLVRGRLGWTVLTGCCHRGLRNTLRTARFLAGNEEITAIVGGLHLRKASDETLDRVGRLLEEFGPPVLYPCHCSGTASVGKLEKQLGLAVRPISAGSRIKL
jgi:7,8-dihydropterin-6-yl-methyl-4-(beta-D-ribofuranosyl)aminobenzene 5'-phosphate synthase